MFSIVTLNDVNPVRHYARSSVFTAEEDIIIDKEIKKLIKMKVIKEVEHHPEEFLSPIFIVPKKNGEYRMILNLKELNEFIEYHHFKMDTFESVLKLVKPGSWFASVDLRHAYYSVSIAPEHRIKLRFEKSGKVYQFEALPNGISCAPKQFTRLMKPVYASLRMLGHTNSGYIDDSLLMGDTIPECKQNVQDTVSLMSDVGFIIHNEKSVLVPTQNITFLGNNIDSVRMIVYLPTEKVSRIVQACVDLHNKVASRIREVARVLGLLVSSFSAVEFGPLYYRDTEREKIEALQKNRGDYDGFMSVTDKIRNELKWWIDNLNQQKRRISHGNPELVITTDASNIGWGAVLNETSIGGRWSEHEAHNHINFLELLAASHAVKSFCKDKTNVHVQVRSDNSCTIAYIRNMGGKIDMLNQLARQIWLWCCERNIWLSATHVPGIDNEADASSRKFNDNVEWMLNEHIFSRIVEQFGEPDIDMFASRLNKQLNRYVSWKPDPGAEAVDAFSMDWSGKFMYAFPPFSVMGRLVQKVQVDQAEMVLVAPVWVTQNFYTPILEMLIQDPLIVKVRQDTLRIPGSSKVHPLVNKLHLMVCRISGDHMKAETYRNNLLKSLWHRGEDPPKSNIHHTSANGFSSVVKGRIIYFKPL